MTPEALIFALGIVVTGIVGAAVAAVTFIDKGDSL